MIRPVICHLWWLLALALGSAGAGTPCAPFEDGRVEAEILTAMREAAADGRMYRIDSDVSKIGFCVRHFPFQEYRGEFTNIVGGLALPPGPADHGHALLLIHTASLTSNNVALTPLAVGHHFLNAAKYPEILYVGEQLEWLDEGVAHIFGTLTLRGLARPVIFDVKIETVDAARDAPDRRIRLRGISHVSRSSFEMRSHRLFVSETIQLCVDVELVLWDS